MSDAQETVGKGIESDLAEALAAGDGFVVVSTKELARALVALPAREELARYVDPPAFGELDVGALYDADARATALRRADNILALLSTHPGADVVWLRDVGNDDYDCWVVCARGDPGAVAFRAVVATNGEER